MKSDNEHRWSADAGRSGQNDRPRSTSIISELLPLAAATLLFLSVAAGTFADSPEQSHAAGKKPNDPTVISGSAGSAVSQVKQRKVKSAQPASSVALHKFGQEIRHLYKAEGKIGKNLYQTGLRRGIPAKIMREMVDMLGYLVDFQRDLKPNHDFVVIYEQYLRPDGQKARVGKLIYAGIQINGQRYGVWSFRRPDGQIDYFNAKGRSIRTALLRTPVNGASISSGFGQRKHPILGYTRLHRGVDFAAKKGTPVYASGDGEVERVVRSAGGLGNHIRIRHASGFSTVYGHLSKIAAGLRVGQKVRQGQVIGQVGSTGLSTGPHLHYEVWRNGAAIDPANLKLQTRLALVGDALAAFRWQAALVMMKPATRLLPRADKTARKR